MNNVSAYIIGFVVAVVMLVVAAVVSSLITFRPDNSDCKSRKVWFWVLGALTPVFSFLIAFFAVYVGIKANSKQESYMIAMASPPCCRSSSTCCAAWPSPKSISTASLATGSKRVVKHYILHF